MDNTLQIHQMLTDSIFEVFEKMFYIFLEPADEEAGTHHWRSSIYFSGPFKGEMAALFSPPLAEIMVQNMLNVEREQIAESLTGDCLKEAMNMICGNFLQKFDPSSVFDLSIPYFTSVAVGEPPPSLLTCPAALRLNFAAGAGGWLELIVRTRQNPRGEANWVI